MYMLMCVSVSVRMDVLERSVHFIESSAGVWGGDGSSAESGGIRPGEGLDGGCDSKRCLKISRSMGVIVKGLERKRSIQPT